MRIYDGSPRQDWEEVLRSVGSWCDHEGLKDVLMLELEGGFLIQGLQAVHAGAWAESAGSMSKRILELTDDRIAELVDEASQRRGSVKENAPVPGPQNYYEQSMRIIGRYLENEKPRDLFLFEQGGSYVVRTLVGGAAGGISHQLAEFTRDELLAMIEAAPGDRR